MILPRNFLIALCATSVKRDNIAIATSCVPQVIHNMSIDIRLNRVSDGFRARRRAIEMNRRDPTSRLPRPRFHNQLATSISGAIIMTVVRYEPWSLVNRLQRDIDRLFSAPQTTAADSGAWLPPVDIHEEDNQFVLHVDLPGVDPKAVEITSEQGRAHHSRPAREDASARRAKAIAASSASPANSSGASACRRRRTCRTSRPKSVQRCAGSHDSEACAGAAAADHGRSRLRELRRALLRVRSRIERR